MAFPLIFFLFIGMPILEIFVLIQVGSSIGPLLTIGIVILTAIIGTWMLRAQGLSTLNKARKRMTGGEVPAFELMEGLALGVGGALLLTPGFVTDAIGFACLIPVTRRIMVNALSKRVTVGSVVGGFGASVSPGSGPDSRGARSPYGSAKSKPEIDGDVIEGEYTRKD